MVILNHQPNNYIHVLGMRDGQIGVIRRWADNVHIGEIVQRYGDTLIVIGKGWSDSWVDIFKTNKPLCNCHVEILPNETTLTIQANQ